MPFATFLSLARSMHRCSDMVGIASRSLGHGGAYELVSEPNPKKAAQLPPSPPPDRTPSAAPRPSPRLRPPRTRTHKECSLQGQPNTNGALATGRPSLRRRAARDGGAPELRRCANPTRAADAAAPRLRGAGAEAASHGPRARGLHRAAPAAADGRPLPAVADADHGRWK